MPAPDKVAPRRLAAALVIAAALYAAWVKAGRPRGIRNVAAEAEEVSE